jgi:cytochrome c551/c552
MRTKLFVSAVLLLAGGATFAGPPLPTTQSEFANATRGMDRHGVAEYVFKTYGCDTCHIAAANGQAGFTARGESARGRFVGCVRLLTAAAATAAAATPSAEQRATSATFNEFGCTFCHASVSGAMGYTEIGRTLGSLHLGCVEVRQEVNKGGSR